MGDLASTLARLETRFGAQAVVRGAVAERRAGERRFPTGTALDPILAGGIATGAPLAFVGEGSCGVVSLALRAVAAVQGEGGTALWIDPTASLDPLSAAHAGVDLARLIVVRPRTRDDALLAAAAALRGDGFRAVAVDVGPALCDRLLSIDDLAPILPLVRGSTAALLVVSERAGRRVAIPACAFERVAWRRELGRVVGWELVARTSRGEARLALDAFGRTVLLNDAGRASLGRGRGPCASGSSLRASPLGVPSVSLRRAS